MMKHNPTAVGHAAAVTTALIFIICRLAFALVPNLALAVGQSWFHGIGISQLIIPSLTWGSFVLGLITSTVGTWIVGYLFALLYNYFVRE